MADEQHGFPGGVQLAFEPPFGRHVEEVVGFVEDEHVVLAPEEVFECQPLLFAAAQGAERPVGDVAEIDAERPTARLIPGDLDVVAAGVAPRGERIGVLHRVVGES